MPVAPDRPLPPDASGGREPSGAAAVTPRTSSALSRVGSLPAGVARGDVDHDVRRQADLVDPALVRRQPAGDRQLERAALAGQLAATAGRSPCRTTVWPTSVARFDVLERAGDDLARRRAPAVDEARRPAASGPSRRRRAGPSVATWLPCASCSQKIDPGADELAGDLAGRRHEAARVAAQVEDELASGPARDVVAAGPSTTWSAAASEKPGQPDVADGRRRPSALLVDLLLAGRRRG